MSKKEVWITDNSNIKYQRIKGQFVDAMMEQTKGQRINYYDFLLVAKKLSFRFEESSHLMALKNYFAKNKNSVMVKKISDLLCISQESLHAQEQKIIVKFIVPETQFAPIKEETLQDEEDAANSEAELSNDMFQKMGSDLSNEEQRQINEKMTIILSIKVSEMDKKIKSIVGNDREPNCLFTLVQESGKADFTYEELKSLILLILGTLKEKIKMSEDDIKTIFFVLDGQKKGLVTVEDMQVLRSGVEDRLKDFYKSRINRDMVKNTLFKLGKVKNNSIQIYQVKNASLLEFQNMEKAIVQSHHQTESNKLIRLKPTKVPHFGPLKGAALANRQRATAPVQHSATRVGQSQIKLERQKIEKILRVSKEEKRRDKKGQTVASKLRSLFIHKVILPRQKMLDDEKERYLRNRGMENDLSIKPSYK